MRAREGDLIKTKDDVIFDVKGLVHPPNKVIAFPRFLPSPQGSRGHQKVLYNKVYSFSERFKFLKQNSPDLIVHDTVFDEVLCEVPTDTIKKHYKPIEKLRELSLSKTLGGLKGKAVQLAETLKKAANIPWGSMGISGSLLVGLDTLESDVDPVVYGVENCSRAYAALQRLLKDDDSHFTAYSRKDLRTLFAFRSKDTIMSFDEFAAVESRKAFQGKFMNTDYFVRFVKGWSQTSEQYGDVCYKNCGYAKIVATIADDAEALFTPCIYRVENAKVVEGAELQPILEIVSFRGRFCAQARKGEAIVAQGKVERVADKRKEREYYRILLGNKTSDYMALSRV